MLPFLSYTVRLFDGLLLGDPCDAIYAIETLPNELRAMSAICGYWNEFVAKLSLTHDPPTFVV